MNFDNTILNNLETEMKKERISSCLIFNEGETVFQFYKNQKSETKLFKVNSVTKSVLSILFGIAIEQGFIDGVNTPISKYFPTIEDAKREITIENLLTMTPGFEWPEWGEWGGRPFPMINSKDWTRYILEKKMITTPGVEMVYNSGASHLLSAILQKVTNGKLTDYAEKVLFKPLGITDYEWHEDSKGISIGGFGLSLKACDMLKIGILMVQNGKWFNKQIISQEWIRNSTVAKFHTYDNVGSYGYHWWIMADENRKPIEPYTYFAMGYGGQYIIISPEIELVVVFTCAKYMETIIPLQLFKKSILNDQLSIKK